MSLKSPRKIDKMVISDDVSVQVNLLTTISTTMISTISIMTISTHPQMQKITMRFEEPPILEKQSEKEQMALQRQQMAAAAGCLNLEILNEQLQNMRLINVSRRPAADSKQNTADILQQPAAGIWRIPKLDSTRSPIPISAAEVFCQAAFSRVVLSAAA